MENVLGHMSMTLHSTDMRRFKLYDAFTEHDLGITYYKFFLFFFFKYYNSRVLLYYDFMTSAYELLRKHIKKYDINLNLESQYNSANPSFPLVMLESSGSSLDLECPLCCREIIHVPRD